MKNLMEVFHEEYLSDCVDQKKQEKDLIIKFENSDVGQKELIDNIFMTLCGWSFKTLLDKRIEE